MNGNTRDFKNVWFYFCLRVHTPGSLKVAYSNSDTEMDDLSGKCGQNK